MYFSQLLVLKICILKYSDVVTTLCSSKVKAEQNSFSFQKWDYLTKIHIKAVLLELELIDGLDSREEERD